ncbi:MAG: tRNA (adenosine(37)-N6)-dimethylallyltransferase MiaA [Verrucomicrobiota bacterium]
MNICLKTSPVFIVGPTGVGKSAVAMQLAEKIGGEIVSVDSMQVYRGLDIGTAKPNPAERQKIPHHLIDVAGLTDDFDAARFCLLSQKAVVEIQARERVPIFCGGTGFYLKAFLEGLGDAPPANAELRAALEKVPLAALLEELNLRDPIAFARIDQKNPRRVLRAVETIRLSGKPFSEYRPVPSVAPERLVQFCFGLKRGNADLHARINRRVDEMFARGLVAETEQLRKEGLEQNQTALQAIGYRQVMEHLRGERSLAETIELIKIRTRQFAKRQMTWFRRQMRLQWISLQENTGVEEAVRQIHDLGGAS